jgi:DnaJ-class molecular chaperone
VIWNDQHRTFWDETRQRTMQTGQCPACGGSGVVVWPADSYHGEPEIAEICDTCCEENQCDSAPVAEPK